MKNSSIFNITQRIFWEQTELAVEVNNKMLSKKDKLNRIKNQALIIAASAKEIINICDLELKE